VNSELSRDRLKIEENYDVEKGGRRACAKRPTGKLHATNSAGKRPSPAQGGLMGAKESLWKATPISRIGANGIMIVLSDPDPEKDSGRSCRA